MTISKRSTKSKRVQLRSKRVQRRSVQKSNKKLLSLLKAYRLRHNITTNDDGKEYVNYVMSLSPKYKKIAIKILNIVLELELVVTQEIMTMTMNNHKMNLMNLNIYTLSISSQIIKKCQNICKYK